MEILGVLSGIGHLPVEVARSAKSLGYQVVAVGVVPGIDEELEPSVDSVSYTHLTLPTILLV